MDCIEAQRLISEALDGEPIAPETLRDAKAHCAGCTTCLAYVKSLAAAHRAPLPEPPADLADRVMARVRAEADAMAAEEALALAQATGIERAPEEPPPEKAPVDVRALWAKLTTRENRRAVAVWAGVAAMLLVFVGLFALSGVREILRPSSRASLNSGGTESASSSRQGSAAVPHSSAEKGAPSAGGTATTDLAAGGSAATQNYIAAGGFVYRMVGPSTYARSNLATGGTTSSSLATSDPPKSLTYYTAPEKGRIVLDDGTGNLIVFEIVTRDFAGRRFAERTGDILAYGEWPTLPPPMQAPANPDGAPQFQVVGTSDGVNAYVQTGTTADAGIAIGPNTPATDPAAGNPDWTWWTPVK